MLLGLVLLGAQTCAADASPRIFFAKDSGARGNELWATNGTFDGTYMVADINAYAIPGAAAAASLAKISDGLASIHSNPVRLLCSPTPLP